jgi:hypothetical protein
MQLQTGFEHHLITQFAQSQNNDIRKALEKGYILVFITRAFKMNTQVQVRGSQIALTGFLNSVPEGVTVMLEWW